VDLAGSPEIGQVDQKRDPVNGTYRRFRGNV